MSRLTLLAFFALILISLPAAFAQDMPARDQLPPGAWHMLTPGGETTCGRGAPYSFHVREGAGDGLLINFQGGGMCWNASTCNIPTTTFDDSVLPNDPSDNPALFLVGITDFGRPDNPFAEYDMIYVNYCTGDMHTGNAVVGYDDNGFWYEVRHKGAVNVRAVLDWVYAHYPAPSNVFVTGCSAGSVGAAYWASDIMRRYSGRRVALLGDSGGGWRGNMSNNFALWGAGQGLSIEQFYIRAARNYPNNRVAQYNTAYDETQSFFHFVGFAGVEYREALRLNLGEIANRARNFRSYTQGGNLHCIIPRGEFYSYAANNVRVRDWVADIAAGNPVNTIQCSECENQTFAG
jgi:hypothetical protein